MPTRGATKAADLARERSRDHAANADVVRVPARDFADLVKSRDRNHSFMRRNLENRIRRGVEDRFPAAHVLGPEFLQNGRAAARVVSDELHASITLDLPNE